MQTYRMACPKCTKLLKVEVPAKLDNKKRRAGECPRCHRQLEVSKINQKHILTITA